MLWRVLFDCGRVPGASQATSRMLPGLSFLTHGFYALLLSDDMSPCQFSSMRLMIISLRFHSFFLLLFQKDSITIVSSTKQLDRIGLFKPKARVQSWEKSFKKRCIFNAMELKQKTECFL